MTQTLRAIYAVFVEMTGQTECKYKPAERLLYNFHRNEFTAENLRTVLRFMLWQNSKREPKYRDRLQIHKILEPELFNSRLGEASAWERNLIARKTARDRVLEQSGRAAEKVETKPRHISEVMKGIV